MATCHQCSFKSPEGFAFCGKCGTRFENLETPSEQNDSIEAVELNETERRPLTILFCDLVDSTSMSERLDPEDLLEVMLTYQQTAREVVESYEGHIAQYLGDGFLVYFGFPTVHEDDASRTVAAGLEVIQAIEKLHPTIKRKFGVDVAVRIAAHSGVVVTSTIGSEKHAEKLALGSAPIIAARLQSIAEPNTLVISDTTRKLITQPLECRSLGSHRLKGVKDPIHAWSVQGLHREAANDASTSSDTTPDSGSMERSLELGTLNSELNYVRQNLTSLVYVKGEAGIGKTHLIDLFLSAAENLFTFRLRCGALAQSSPLRPVVTAFEKLFGIDHATTSFGTIADSASQFGVSDETELALLANLFSVDHDHAQLKLATPELIRSQTETLLCRILLQLAKEQTMAVWVDDLHWADSLTRDFLIRLRSESRDNGLLVILCSRPMDAAQTVEFAPEVSIELGSLSSEEANELVTRTASGTDIPEEVVKQIVRRANGVPLFVVELTKSIIDAALLPGDKVNPLVEIPSSLQSLFFAKLDALGPVKTLAQLLSALGDRLDLEIIQAILPADYTRLQEDLELLVSAGILDQIETQTYAFQRDLVQESTYESMLKSTRASHHSVIATAFEEKFPRFLDTQPELIAHHLSEGGELERAVPLWLSAGQLAIQRASNVEAKAHLTKGLADVSELPEGETQVMLEIGLCTAMGSTIMATDGYTTSELEHTYLRALELCSKIEGSTDQFWIKLGLCYFHLVRCEFSEAMHISRQLLDLANQLEEPSMLFSAYQATGMALHWQGDFLQSTEHLEAAMALDTPDRDFALLSPTNEDPRVPVLCFLSWNYWHRGDIPHALKLSDRALLMARQADYPFGLAYALVCNAMLYQYCCDTRTTESLVLELSELVENYGYPYQGVIKILSHWAKTRNANMGISETRAQLQEMRDGLEQHRSNGSKLLQTCYLTIIADAAFHSGLHAECTSAIEEGLRLARQTGELAWQPELLRLSAELQLKDVPTEGDRKIGESILLEAKSGAIEMGSLSLELRNSLSLARYRYADDDTDDARQIIEQALTAFPPQEGNFDVDQARAFAASISH